MNIGFESLEEVKDAVQETPTVVEQAPADGFPPKLEGDEEAGVIPPRLEPEGNCEVSFGESVEHRGARKDLENAIKSGNSIAVKYAERDLAKVTAKEMAKKLQSK